MKKLLLLSVTAISFFAGSHNALAGSWGTKVTTITGFYVYSTGNAHFKVADMENPDGCATPGYLTLISTDPNFKQLYDTLMTAYIQGKTVQLAYNGCTTGYPIVTSIAIPSVW